MTELLQILINLFSFLWKDNTSHSLEEISEELKEIKTRYSALNTFEIDDSALVGEELEELKNNTETFVKNLKEFSSEKVVSSSEWEDFNKPALDYFTQNYLILTSNHLNEYTYIGEEIIGFNFKAMNFMASEVENMALFDCTCTLNNIFNLIQFIDIFNQNPILNEIGDLVNQNPSLEGISKENFFSKIQPRPLIKNELKDSSKLVYEAELDILKKVLKNHISKYN